MTSIECECGCRVFAAGCTSKQVLRVRSLMKEIHRNCLLMPLWRTPSTQSSSPLSPGNELLDELTVPSLAWSSCVLDNNDNNNNKKAQLRQRSARDSVGIVAPPGESEYNTQHRLLAKFRENSNVQQFKVIQGRWFWHQSKTHIRLPISD